MRLQMQPPNVVCLGMQPAAPRVANDDRATPFPLPFTGIWGLRVSGVAITCKLWSMIISRPPCGMHMSVGQKRGLRLTSADRAFDCVCKAWEQKMDPTQSTSYLMLHHMCLLCILYPSEFDHHSFELVHTWTLRTHFSTGHSHSRSCLEEWFVNQNHMRVFDKCDHRDRSCATKGRRQSSSGQATLDVQFLVSMHLEPRGEFLCHDADDKYTRWRSLGTRPLTYQACDNGRRNPRLLGLKSQDPTLSEADLCIAIDSNQSDHQSVFRRQVQLIVASAASQEPADFIL
nr:hypothetical protein CFP56_37276 [Quercus suber]